MGRECLLRAFRYLVWVEVERSVKRIALVERSGGDVALLVQMDDCSEKQITPSSVGTEAHRLLSELGYVKRDATLSFQKKTKVVDFNQSWSNAPGFVDDPKNGVLVLDAYGDYTMRLADLLPFDNNPKLLQILNLSM